MIEVKNFNTYVFFLFLIGASILAFWLFKPFLAAIIFALILAELFRGVYKFFVKNTRNKKGLSSILTIFVIILVIVIPIFVVISLMANEANHALSFVRENGLQNTVDDAFNSIQNLPLIGGLNLETIINQDQLIESLKNVSGSFLNVIQRTYQSVARFIIMALVMFFTVFYLLIDREKFAKKIMYLLPLKDSQERTLSQRFMSISKATLKGTVVIGLIQGILGGAIFALLGIPSAIIWAVVMTILSIIPAVGSGLIWFPAALFLLFSGNIWQGIVLILFGLLVISTIDNVLRPKLVGRDSTMHPLLVFFSTLGGLAAFGIVGFIIGPIIMALFIALWEIYGYEFRSQLKSFNK